MTLSFHQQRILKHLGFRKWQSMDEPLIELWLIQQRMEHDNERMLLEKLCRKLIKNRTLRPAISALQRIVGCMSEQLHEETYRRLSFLWNDALLKQLDDLLEVDAKLKSTQHRWLCSAPTANTQREINKTLDKIMFLKTMHMLVQQGHQVNAKRIRRLFRLMGRQALSASWFEN